MGAHRPRPRVLKSRRLEVGLLFGSAAVVTAGAAFHFVTPQAAPAPTTPPSASASALDALPRGAELTAAPEESLPLSGCAIPDRGMGPYTEVQSATPFTAKVYVAPDVVGDETYPLLLHFHGGDAVRKVVAPEKLDLVIATVDKGNGSRAYESVVGDRRAWTDLVAGIDEHVSSTLGRTVHARSVIVSSWSAGYKAVEGLLSAVPDDPSIAGIVLLDSLHAGYLPGKTALAHGQLAPFVAAARRAAEGSGFFFDMAHSEIVPPGYASTSETAAFVLGEVGVPSSDVQEGGLDLLPLASMARRGRLDVRGYHGSDAAAHCDELRLLPGILKRELTPHAR